MKLNFLFILILFIQTNAFCQESIDDDRVYFLKKHNKKLYIANEDEKRLTKDFDTITNDRKFIFCYLNKRITLYTKDSLKLVVENARAIYPLERTKEIYQMLFHNELVWLTDSNKKQNEDPNNYQSRIVCGNVFEATSRINKYSDSTIYTIQTTDADDWAAKPKLNRINITSLVGESTLTFLNNSTTLQFSGNSEFSLGLDNLTFIEKTIQGKFNIVRLDILNKSFTKYLLLENISKLYSTGFKPFIYQQKELFGFYPLTKKAKYKFLMPFNGNFARFMLVNGKCGWLDKTGVEYVDE